MLSFLSLLLEAEERVGNRCTCECGGGIVEAQGMGIARIVEDGTLTARQEMDNNMGRSCDVCINAHVTCTWPPGE